LPEEQLAILEVGLPIVLFFGVTATVEGQTDFHEKSANCSSNDIAIFLV
jgi:hypothetical protein